MALLSQESARRAGEAESAHGDNARHADLEGGHALGERFGKKVRALKIKGRQHLRRALGAGRSAGRVLFRVALARTRANAVGCSGSRF